MSRRDRIRARLIYRAWSIERQLRWFPPYGWVTKMQALGLSYNSGTQDLADAMAYMLQVNRPLTIGVDPASGPDMIAYTIRKGDKITFLDVPVMDPAFEEKVESLIEHKRKIFENLLYKIMTNPNCTCGGITGDSPKWCEACLARYRKD